jgi:hypothetical protein
MGSTRKKVDLRPTRINLSEHGLEKRESNGGPVWAGMGLSRGGCLKRGGKRTRLVGAGVAEMKGGDACVAHGEWDKERGRRTQEQDAGDHKGPHPAQPNPRPYGGEGGFRGDTMKYLPLRAGVGWRWVGTLVVARRARGDCNEA